jgi:ribonuclease P protein component
VDRNRARRRVREAYRLIKERIRGHYDIAFVLYPGDFSFSQRYQQVESLLRRSGVIVDQ